MIYTSKLCFDLSSDADKSVDIQAPEVRHIWEKGYTLYWVKNVPNRHQQEASLVLDHPSLNFVLMLNPKESSWGFSNRDAEEYLLQKLILDFPHIHDSIETFRHVFQSRKFHLSSSAENTYTNAEGFFTTADKWQIAIRTENLEEDNRNILFNRALDMSVWEGRSDQSLAGLLLDASAIQRMIDIVSDKHALLKYLKGDAVKTDYSDMPRVISEFDNDDDYRNTNDIDDVFCMSLNAEYKYSLGYFFVEARLWRDGNVRFLKIRPFYFQDDKRHPYFVVSPHNLVQLGPGGNEINWSSGSYSKELVYCYSEEDIGFSMKDSVAETMNELLKRFMDDHYSIDPTIFENAHNGS